MKATDILTAIKRCSAKADCHDEPSARSHDFVAYLAGHLDSLGADKETLAALDVLIYHGRRRPVPLEDAKC